MSEAFSSAPDAPAAPELWLSCVEQLAQELPEQQFSTWIKPLVAELAPDLSRLSIQVANRFKLDWIRAQYSARISALLEQLAGHPIPLELVLAPRENSARPAPVSLSLIHISEPTRH